MSKVVLVIPPLQTVSYGRPATEALAATIAAAKSGHPLAPVTAVVASNFVGLSARRQLGSAAMGIANVSFLTPFQLAERVSSDLLLDTRPLTNPVLRAAVRRVLAVDPGPYRPVARHEATEAALAALFAELSNVDEAGLESIVDEGSQAARSAVRFHRAIGAELVGFHTEHDLAAAAADRADLARQLLGTGHLVWFLPAPITPALGRFIDRALDAAPSSSVIVGLTGDDDADESVWRGCEAAGIARINLPAQEPPTATHVVSVTDAAEEVRVVASRIVALAEQGTPLHRIGVFYPAPDPYLRIIEHQFTASQLPSNGPDPRRLADSVAGRTLLGALALPELRWRRDRVMALVAGGPVRAGDARTRPTAWDDLSREAGVVRDLADWRAKLGTERSATQLRLADADAAHTAAAADGGRRTQRLLDRLTDIDQVLAFVDGLAERLAAIEQARSWPAKCVATSSLMQWLLGDSQRRSAWPDGEQAAFDRVDDALVRLRTLDDLEPNPSTEVFLRALNAELDVARGRHGRFGEGVVFGPLASAVGHDLDAVFVLGAAEGLLPVARRDDALLPEEVRLRSLDQLESKSARLHHQHRSFLAALASAPPAGRTIMFPRGDLRGSRRALASRWLLDTVSALAGERVHATEFERLGPGVCTTVGSHASGICGSEPSASIDDRDLAVIAAHRAQGGHVADHPLALLAGRGIEMRLARASADFTEFDGNLGAEGPFVSIDEPMSPSRLETWATCGFRYFLAHALGLADRDDPERVDDLSPLDRGSLIHDVLERFIAEAIAQGPPAPHQPWTPAQRDRLRDIAHEEFALYEQRGRTGRAVRWLVQKHDILDLLDSFIETDEVFRSSWGATPAVVELDFGVRSGEPVRLDLANGRSVALRGRADRVDTTIDGRVVVSDYKTGRPDRIAGLDTDPVLAGTKLQLGLYAEAARRHTGLDEAHAAYWMIEAAPDSAQVGYPWSSERRERFVDVITAITDGIAQGVFAPDPGEWNTWRQTHEACTHCPFDSVCVRNRGEEADAKRDAPELAVRDRLRPVDPTTTPSESSS